MAGVLLKGRQARLKRIMQMRRSSGASRYKLHLVRDSIYHKLAVQNVGTYSFFRNLANNTLYDTNLVQAGRMNYDFDAIGMVMWAQYGITKENWTTFYNSGVLDLNIRGQNLIRLPAHRIPSGGGPQGFASTTNPAQEIFFASNGVPSPNGHFPLHVEGASLFIGKDMEIEALLNLGTALTAANYIWVALDGFKSMPSFM